MLESAVHFLSTTDIPLWGILAFALFISFFENIFPPSPSDTILLFMGTLAAFGKVGFIELIIFATIGSTLGFLLMYLLGKFFGHRIIHSNKFPFVNERTLEKPRVWFNNWGYTIIIINRFLSGTRAVISFFAGITDLRIDLTIILSTVSALLWNAILIILGMTAGKNWRLVDSILEMYGNIVMIIVALIAVFYLVRFFVRKKKRQAKGKVSS